MFAAEPARFGRRIANPILMLADMHMSAQRWQEQEPMSSLVQWGSAVAAMFWADQGQIDPATISSKLCTL